MKTKDIRLSLLKVFSGIYESLATLYVAIRLPCLIRGNLASSALTPGGRWSRVNFDRCCSRTLLLLSNKKVLALLNHIFATERW